MKFKTPIPKGLKLNLGFDQDGLLEIGDYTVAVFETVIAGTYDLSFGNNQMEARQYLNKSQLICVAYDKDGKYVTLTASAWFRDIFAFNGTAIILDGDNAFQYFDKATKKFIKKEVKYPFTTGKGNNKLNEVTEDVAVYTHDYYASIQTNEIKRCYNALVSLYNSFKPVVKVGALGVPRKSFEHFEVNVMINKNFEV